MEMIWYSSSCGRLMIVSVNTKHSFGFVILSNYNKCMNTLWLGKKKKLRVFTVRRPTLIFGPDPKLILLVDNYLNTLFLPPNVVFDA